MSAQDRIDRRNARIDASLSVPKRAPKKPRAKNPVANTIQPMASKVTVRDMDSGEVLRTERQRKATSRGGKPGTVWQGPRRSEASWLKVTTAGRRVNCTECDTRIEPGRFAFVRPVPTRPRLTEHRCPPCHEAAQG